MSGLTHGWGRPPTLPGVLLLLLAGLLPGATDPAAQPQAPVVCVDPGHPSEVNSGRTVQNGVTELAMDWEVALRLTRILEQEYGVRVVRTRTEREKTVTNRERAEIANRAGAALFLRLHCDTGNGSGYAVYYPDRQGTKAGRTGPPRAVIEASREAARAVNAGMAEVLGKDHRDNGVRGESRTFIGGRQGALTGSIFAEVPAVTVEMAVLSNPKDAAYIRGEAGQEQMARALAVGAARAVSAARRGSGALPGPPVPRAARAGRPGSRA